MKIFAETERLILREIVPGDENGLYELDSDPEVHRYLGNKPVTSLDEIRALIRFIRKQYEEKGIGRWAVIDKASGEFLGWAGLKRVTEPINNHVDYLDLGYRLIKRHWGKGIATEASFASLDYGFRVLNAAEIYGMADCGNAGSHHVLQKAGLTFIETFDYDGTAHNWYRIGREEWEAARSKG